MTVRPQALCDECKRMIDVCNPIWSREGNEPVYRKHKALRSKNRRESWNCPNSRMPVPIDKLQQAADTGKE